MIRVLIADDHAIVRDGLRMILETHGQIEVVGESSDGLDTVKLVKSLRPDVVLMDISMPNLNGIEATTRIISQFPEIKIVILSMHSSPEDIFRALKAGAIGYLLKESAGKEVVDAIFAAGTGKRYLSRKVDDILIDSYILQHSHVVTESPIGRLSSREREVLQMVAEGKTSNEIAAALFLSVKTVETYRSRLMQKLGVSDLAALVKFAVKHGVI